MAAAALHSPQQGTKGARDCSYQAAQEQVQCIEHPQNPGWGRVLAKQGLGTDAQCTALSRAGKE